MGITREKLGIRQKINNRKTIFIILPICFTFIVITGILFLPFIGRFLIFEDDLQKSDVIIVLTGSISDRIPHAVDLYNEGYSNRILIVNSYPFDYELFLERGQQIPPGKAQKNKKAALNLGILEQNISILEGDAESTQDEAVILRGFLRNNKEINSMIIVTSRYHSKRAKAIFTKAMSYLDRKVNIYSSPSIYDPFNGEQWWSNKKDIVNVILEYIKLAKFYIWDQYLLLE